MSNSASWANALERIDPPKWEPTDRPSLLPHQIPPDGRWDLWILMGGRGSGKTEACARYFARWMRMHPGHRGRIIAPTSGDAVESCVLGPSGLRSIDPEVRFIATSPGGAKVVWPNGSEALVIGTSQPRDVDRLRAGGNRHIDWWEEMAANPHLGDAWTQAEYGLRLGSWPHSIASTTPRNVKKLRELLADEGTVTTHGTIFDNPYSDPHRKEILRRKYEGTRLGRQELGGELLEDVPGALWTWDGIERDRRRADRAVDLVRVVVAVDPAMSHGEDADETGIVICAKGGDGHGYVLGDLSCQESPDRWAQIAVKAYDFHRADRVIGEKNNGGELVEATVRTVRPAISYEAVWASRGKRVRAEPIAALYEQGRVHHIGMFPDLEDEMCTWTPEVDESPNRMDALVWGLTYLGLADLTAFEVSADDHVVDEWVIR